MNFYKPNTPALRFPADGYIFDTHNEMQNEIIGKIEEEGIEKAIQ